jgi:heptosyltransferase II
MLEKNAKKILIIGPSWVGDMVMAQSLFKTLKLLDENITIDVLALDWCQPILKRMPEVRRSINMPISHGKLGLNARFRLAKDLRTEVYTQAIILANSWKSALIPFWAKIPLRTGWLGELRWGLLNDVRYLNKKQYPRMVQRYVRLAYSRHQALPKELPVPLLTTSSEVVNKILDKFNLDLKQPILALCPGAAFGPAKRWPEAYYAEIARAKIAQGWGIWLFGSEQDKPVIAKIKDLLPGENIISFAGKINLLETVDLLSVVNKVVTNDSGLMHMAASLDKPVVAIYGSTSPNFTPPLSNKAQIMKTDMACSPCFSAHVVLITIVVCGM